MITRTVATILTLSGLLLACRSASREHDWFFDLPPGAQGDTIGQFAIAEQVDIYLSGLHRRPPATYLARRISGDPLEVAAVVFAVADTIADDWHRAMLLYVLEYRVCNGGVANGSTILEGVDRVIEEIDNRYAHDDATEFRNRIVLCLSSG